MSSKKTTSAGPALAEYEAGYIYGIKMQMGVFQVYADHFKFESYSYLFCMPFADIKKINIPFFNGSAVAIHTSHKKYSFQFKLHDSSTMVERVRRYATGRL